MRKALIAAFLLLAATVGAHAYDVKEIGSYFIGGHIQTLSGMPEETVYFYPGAPPTAYNPNGDVHTGQMYVHFVRLAQPRGKVPVILVHGGGLSGTGWESTPDGRPGWQQFFLAAGFDVIVPDQVERGRSNWSRYPQIFTSAPLFRTAQEAWTLFRIGTTYETDPAKRVSWTGGQFPVANYDDFVASFNARWTTTDAIAQAAFDQMVDRECPCVLIAHSAGSGFAIRAALRAPDKIRALVGLEPSAAPNPTTIDIAKLKSIPTLFVWGDHLGDYPDWQKIVVNPYKFQDGMTAQGAKMDVVHLPERGITGNTHMMMLDKNSDQVAGVVRDWLVQQGLAQ
ncbi:MAG: alpha/beta fold hydrolase [Alphaproteobacteria bacterium]|nr:alpha/beta fold hydrolase [Alphaproteobacteria bacterium]